MNTKIIYTLIIGVILVAGAAMFIARISGSEDAWICQNGEWVKHGNPSSFKPSLPCEKNKKIDENIYDQENENQKKIVNISEENNIRITKPMSGDIVSSPVEIIGEARGTWFFEGDFPVKLLDKKGKIIAETPARALGEWMTEDLVPWRAVLEFSAPPGSEGTLVLARDDPSDQAAPDEKEIPVIFGSSQGTRIKLFFSSIYFDPETKDCEKVYAVERVVPKTKAIAKATLEELLAGVTEEEKSAGFFTSINSGVEINSVSVVGGVAKVDFNKKMEEGMGGSCRTAVIRSQIEETLKQFPTVKSVVISVDGKTEGILEP